MAENMTACKEDGKDTCEQGTVFSHSARCLSEDEAAKLQKDKILLSEFKQNKLELEAQKNWDLFYKRNTTKFFKDRNWTTREFHELCDLESKVIDEEIR